MLALQWNRKVMMIMLVTMVMMIVMMITLSLLYCSILYDNNGNIFFTIVFLMAVMIVITILAH